MRKSGLLSTSAIGSAALLSLSLGCAAPAYAQDTVATADTGGAAQGDATAADQSETAITVTGSRIRRPNIVSQLPVVTVTGEEFFQQGQTNIGDTLNELPQLRATRQQNNSNLGVGISGLNNLDLRGLGIVRTLVLVNGRRHVGSDILSTTVATDVNSIPNDLVERVDIVTGGNSAIYGSDAIAGVVNFILRRNFEGIQVRGAAGISAEGYGGNQYISAMYGRNFGDGRGNVTVHAEYARQDRVYGSDVSFVRRNDGFNIIDVDPAGIPEGSDGFPDRAFFRDIRSATISPTGLVPIPQRVGGAAPCGVLPGATNGGPAPANPALPYNCNFIFLPDGSLVPQTGARNAGASGSIFGAFTGGNGSTQREGQLVTMFPFQERMNFNLLAHYEFAPALEAFLEAKYTRVDSRGGNAGATGIQGTFAQFDFRERVRLDNPFLNPAARTTITNAILAAGCNSSLTVACQGATTATGGPLNAANLAAIADGSYRFVIARNLADIGPRNENFIRDTWRVVAGLRGTFNDDWSYEISANYGRFEENTTTEGYVDRQRFMLSIDAGRNPVTGQIQCRSQFDPAARVAFPNNAANQARLAADIAACVPYNPFGAPDNSAAAAYFRYDARHFARITQFVINGFVSGDSSQLFELPGGPVRFALGAEYRRETAFYDNDDFVAGGFTNNVAVGDFDPPPFEVKEAFAELQIPILRETPFFEELTISGAARVANYNGATGTVWAYNAGIDWSPVRGLRFRGNYGRAVRAPNYGETGFPVVPNFAPGFIDPCRANSIGAGTQFRAANCAADLGPLLTTPDFANLAAFSLPILSGSNPNLVEETSDSWSVGAVVQPIPGMSFTADYFDITVDNVIAAVTAQAVVNGCYDLPDLNNPFCASFQRWRGPGTGPLGEVPGQVLGNSLLAASLNYASLRRRGIDFEAAYRTNLGGDLRLDTRAVWTHNLQTSNFLNPTLPDFENRLLGELSFPVDEARLDVALSHGPFTIGYQLTYIGPMVVNLWEDFNELQGRPPQDNDWADIREIPAVFYHDLRFEWNIRRGNAGIGSDLNFYVGVDNLLDTEPPLGFQGNGERAAGGGTGSQIYNTRGRNFYAGFRARF